MAMGVPQSVAGERLRFAFPDQESFPNILGKDRIANPPGVYPEMLQRVADDLHVEARFLRMPTKRILKSLCDGTIDVAVEFSYLPERTRCGRYPMRRGEPDASRRLDELAYYLYTLSDSPLTWDGQRFTHVRGRLGANMGYSILHDLAALGMPVETATDTESNLLKLRYGRIIGYVQVDKKLDKLIEREKIDGLRKHPVPVVRKPYYIVFSQAYYSRHPELSERFWDHLGEVREEMLGKLRARYLKSE